MSTVTGAVSGTPALTSSWPRLPLAGTGDPAVAELDRPDDMLHLLSPLEAERVSPGPLG